MPTPKETIAKMFLIASGAYLGFFGTKIAIDNPSYKSARIIQNCFETQSPNKPYAPSSKYLAVDGKHFFYKSDFDIKKVNGDNINDVVLRSGHVFYGASDGYFYSEEQFNNYHVDK